MSNIASMLPGGMGQMLGGLGGSDADSSAHLRKMICVCDSMTPAELDSDGKMFETMPERPEGARPLAQMQARQPNPRVLRVAKGSGTSVDTVEQVMAQYRMMKPMMKTMVRAFHFRQKVQLNGKYRRARLACEHLRRVFEDVTFTFSQGECDVWSRKRERSAECGRNGGNAGPSPSYALHRL